MWLTWPFLKASAVYLHIPSCKLPFLLIICWTEASSVPLLRGQWQMGLLRFSLGLIKGLSQLRCVSCFVSKMWRIRVKLLLLSDPCCKNHVLCSLTLTESTVTASQGSNVVEDQDLLEIGILNSAHRQRLLQAIRLLPRVSKDKN